MFLRSLYLANIKSGFLKANVPARVTIRIDANDFTKRGFNKKFKGLRVSRFKSLFS